MNMKCFSRRFVADRDPARGGLVIITTSKGFSDRTRTELEDNCLEMIAAGYDRGCLEIYPLSDGSFAAAMARKVAGSSRECRPHEIVRGFICSPAELQYLCVKYIAEDLVEELFFPGELDPDQPDAWPHPQVKPETGGSTDAFFNKMDYRTLTALAAALRQISSGRLKVLLQAQEQDRQFLLAVLTRFSLLSGERLFMICDGECTLARPDLVIGSGQLQYLDSRVYKKMTLEDLVKLGRGGQQGSSPSFSEGPAEDPAAAALLRHSEEFLVSKGASEYALYREMGLLHDNDRAGFRKYLRSLRQLLADCDLTQSSLDHFIRLLYAAYKKEPAPEAGWEPELSGAPYDFPAMTALLRKKAAGRRDLRRLMTALLHLQLEAELGEADSRDLHSAGQQALIDF